MKIRRIESFKRDYCHMPKTIQERARKQLLLLLQNPRHPSLRVTKMRQYGDFWEARVSKAYRITFEIVGDTYILRRIGKHDIERKP